MRKRLHTDMFLPEDTQTHLGSRNENHHLVLQTEGKGFPWEHGPAVQGCHCSQRCLVPLHSIVLTMLRGHGVVSEGFSEIGARNAEGHQGYHRLQKERSGSACPNQGSREGSVSLCPCAACSPLFLQQPHLHLHQAATPALWAALSLPPTAELSLRANANTANPRRAGPARAESPTALTVLGRSSSEGQPCRVQKEETSIMVLVSTRPAFAHPYVSPAPKWKAFAAEIRRIFMACGWHHPTAVSRKGSPTYLLAPSWHKGGL